jgi:tetrahydromethanopterin S-methyltransferase subunit G
MKTDFDYCSYQEGERYGMQFGFILGIIIGLAITVAAVFILLTLC